MTDSRAVIIRGYGVKYFSNVHCLPASTLLVVYKKLCYLLFSVSVTIGQFSSNWPGWSSRTVNRDRIVVRTKVFLRVLVIRRF